jgi:HK97 gp10 family phage protein
LIKITLQGDEQLQAFFAQAPEALRTAVTKATKDFAAKVKEEAQYIVPVRTGFLRKSIFYRTLGPMQYIIGATAGYAGYVEWGTSRMMAQPYLAPAIMYASQYALSAYADAIQQEFNSI